MRVTSVVAESVRVYPRLLAFVALGVLVFTPIDILGGISATTDDARVWLPATLVQLGTAAVGYALIGAAVIGELQDGEARGGASPLAATARIRPVAGAAIVASLLATLGIVFGLVLLVVPGLLLATRWALILPVIVVERRTWRDSFGRSRELVRGFGWRVFGVLAITYGGYSALTLPLFWRSDFLSNWLLAATADALVAPFYATAAPSCTAGCGGLRTRRRCDRALPRRLLARSVEPTVDGRSNSGL